MAYLAKIMPKFHVIAGPDASPAYPIVRKIGPADLKDALAEGIDDFYALPLLFPHMSGFALVGSFAAIGLYEISRRRELGLEVFWAHAFDVRHSPSIPSLLALGLLLLVIFICWLATAGSLLALRPHGTGVLHGVSQRHPHHILGLDPDRSG